MSDQQQQLDAVAPCQHPSFKIEAEAQRILNQDTGELLRVMVVIKASCAACGAAMQFIGLPASGNRLDRATVSPDRQEAGLPSVPAGDKVQILGQ